MYNTVEPPLSEHLCATKVFHTSEFFQINTLMKHTMTKYSNKTYTCRKYPNRTVTTAVWVIEGLRS